MANSTEIVNLILQEKGFAASPDMGKVTILADENGEKFNMRIAVLPNGMIGGEIVVPRVSEVREKAKSYINRGSVIYEIFLSRKGCLGKYTITAINAETFQREQQVGAFLIGEDSAIRYVEGNACPEFLEPALFAAFERSQTTFPGCLFYGNIAEDGKPIERKWRDPKKNMME